MVSPILRSYVALTPFTDWYHVVGCDNLRFGPTKPNQENNIILEEGHALGNLLPLGDILKPLFMEEHKKYPFSGSHQVSQ